MKKLILYALIALLPSCTLAQKGTVVFDKVKANTYLGLPAEKDSIAKDSVHVLRIDVTKARDSLIAIRNSITVAINALSQLTRDSSAALRQRDTALVNTLGRTVNDSLAAHHVRVKKNEDTLVVHKNQILIAWAAITAANREIDTLTTSFTDTSASHLYWLGYLRLKVLSHDAALAALYDSVRTLGGRITNPSDTTVVDTTDTDRTAPVAITDLTATAGAAGQVTLAFTAPVGTPTSYDIRYATTNITEAGDSGSSVTDITMSSVRDNAHNSGTTVTIAGVGSFGGNSDDMLVAVLGGYSWSFWYIDSVKSSVDGHFTRVRRDTAEDAHTEIWTLDEPTAGTHAVTFYVRGTPYFAVGVYECDGVSAIRTSNGNQGVAWPLSYVDIPTSSPGELIIDVHSLDPDITTTTWGALQTEGYLYYTTGMSDACGASSYRSGSSGTVTMSLNYLLNGETFVASAIALTPSGAGVSSTMRWADATQYTGEPAPGASGSTESIILSDLPADEFYFAIKSRDASLNESALSNTDNATISALSPYIPPDTTGWRGGYGIAFADSVLSGDKWVDSSVAVSGNGTFASPFKTVAPAITAAASGDTVIIKTGTYNESLALKSGVTITNYAKQRVRIGGTPSGKLYLATGSGVSNVRVQGLDFNPTRIYHDVTTPDYYRIDVADATNLSFEYNSFRQTLEDITSPTFAYADNLRCLNVWEPDRVTFNGNYFYGWSESLVIDCNTTDTTFAWVKNNHFALQGWCAIIVGWPLSPAGFATGGVLIERNLFDLCWGEDHIQWQPYYGGTLAQQQTARHFKHLVRKNVFRDAAENALDFKATGGVFVEENYFYRMLGADDGFYRAMPNIGGTFAVGSEDVTIGTIARGNIFYSNPGVSGNMYPKWKFYNNTSINNRRSVVAGASVDQSRTEADFSHWADPAKVASPYFQLNAFKNNVLVNQYMYVQSSAYDANLDIDYNLYYKTGGTPLFSYSTGTWTDLLGLPLWKGHFNANVLGKEAHSLQTSPAFEDVPDYPSANHTDYDFTPASGSALVDAGGPLTVTTNSGTGSTTLTVQDGGYFRDALGMSVFGVTVDSIQIGATSPVGCSVVSGNAITLNATRNWSIGDVVWLFKNGKKWDDIGAIQR